MGLISAAFGSANGVFADQWLDYFYCESMEADVLAVKGHKRVSRRSSNKRGSDNIITNGSVIAVADGQCMVIVEQGKIVDFCAEPGEYKYDSTTEPSLFDGGKLGENIKKVFANVGKRFAFGGEAPKDQRIYYFNTKEIIGNKYGTPSPVPFRVVDPRAGIDIDISVRCFGEYSYRITDPLTFYVNLCGNMAEEFTRDRIEGQMKSELLTHLQEAFAAISEQGIRYSALPGHATELSEALRTALEKEWKEARGVELLKAGISSVKADPEDEKMIKEMQKSAAYINPQLRDAYLASQAGGAMTAAASNTSGSVNGFMGMGMAAGMGANFGAAFGVGQQQAPVQMAAPSQVAANSWTCPTCGNTAAGKFCPECGTKKPEPAAADGWTCSCGAVNKGRFCTNCGAKKPAAAPLYRCDKCGWEPADPMNPPKFCPECGDPFGEEDRIN